jgi:hypothetical protein
MFMLAGPAYGAERCEDKKTNDFQYYSALIESDLNSNA